MYIYMITKKAMTCSDDTLNWKDIIRNLKIGIDNFYKKGYEIGQKLKEMFDML